jgi:hypothetical protein
MITTTSAPTATIVLESIDIDCDGTGHAFRQVSAPRALVNAIHNAHVNREGAAREANRVLSEMIDSGQFNEQRKREHEVWTNRVTHARIEGKALRDLLMNLLRDADEGPTLGYGDWFPMAPADEHKLISELEAAGDFDWNYWQEEGYYSYFVSTRG